MLASVMRRKVVLSGTGPETVCCTDLLQREKPDECSEKLDVLFGRMDRGKERWIEDHSVLRHCGEGRGRHHWIGVLLLG